MDACSLKSHPPFTFLNWTDNGIKLQCDGAPGFQAVETKLMESVAYLRSIFSSYILGWVYLNFEKENFPGF